MSSTQATGMAVLTPGFAASASAVMPAFGALRVTIDRAYPLAEPTAAHTCAEAARPSGLSCSPLTTAKSAERGNDHAD